MALTTTLLNRRRFVAGLGAGTVLATGLPMSERSAAARRQATPATPAAEQVLRIAGTLPWTRTSAMGSGTAYFPLFSNLHLSPLSADAEGNILPGVCEDYAVSDDLLTYTLRVDPDAKFSDGSKITAGDIKFSWEWLARQGGDQTFYQGPMIAGHAEVVAGQAEEMAGLTATDDATLEIRLSRPFAPFLHYVANCFSGVYPKRAIDEGGDDWDVGPTVTSGPFAIERFDLNTGEMDLGRNPHWWRQTPQLERIEVRVVPDVNSLVLLWRNDEVDVIDSLEPLPLEFITGPDREYVVKSPVWEVRYLLFDTSKPPMDDVEVRRALVHATDLETIVPALYGEAFEPGTGLIHRTEPGAQPRPSFYDPDGATAAIAASPYGGADALPPIAMAFGPASLERRAVEAIQQGWQETLGIAPAVLPTAPGFDPDELDAQILQGGNTPLFRAPGALLTWAWHADNRAFSTVIKTRDEEVEALLVEAEALPAEEVEERARLYREAEALIMDRAYVIPLMYSNDRAYVKPWVANPSFNDKWTFDVINSSISER